MKRKMIVALTALALSSSVYAKNECYILTENIIGTYSQQTLERIQNVNDDQEKVNVITAAIQNNLAVPLKIGTKFCDAGEYNWTWYRKRVHASGTLLWIKENVLAEKL